MEGVRVEWGFQGVDMELALWLESGSAFWGNSEDRIIFILNLYESFYQQYCDWQD
jgi:hypothetical protein